MCLILFDYDRHPRYRLVLAANRDEAFARPTAPAAFWDEAPDLLAGRDLQAGGTWMGLTRTGRFAALTNVRDLPAHREDAQSRGTLVADFLRGNASPETYAEQVAEEAERYNPFNLLVADFGRDDPALTFLHRQEPTPRRLAPGLYGLSNATLDTPWPKVEAGKRRLAHLTEADDPAVEPDLLLDLLADPTRYPHDDLPDTGVGRDLEHVLSAACIRSPDYGTRVSTALLVGRDGTATFVERPMAEEGDDAVFDVPLSSLA